MFWRAAIDLDMSCTYVLEGCCGPGYVVCHCYIVFQDDVVMGTLTVKENIMFSANMRLSAEIPRKEKERRVDETIAELGLSHVANHKVNYKTNHKVKNNTVKQAWQQY